jgi:hypothetical protein
MKVPAEFSLVRGELRAGVTEDRRLAFQAIDGGGQRPWASGRHHRAERRLRQAALVAHDRWQASNSRLDDHQRRRLDTFARDHEEVESVIEAISSSALNAAVVGDSRLTRGRLLNLS